MRDPGEAVEGFSKHVVGYEDVSDSGSRWKGVAAWHEKQVSGEEEYVQR